ncbi:MAG: hypothetical protein ACRDN9_05000 [Streptosporangiaceae bacterium]
MTTGAPVPAVTPHHAGDELIVGDLYANLAEVIDRFVGRLDAAEVLDAFLLAAAATQIVEDFLHRDVFVARRAASYIAPQEGPAANTASLLLRGIAAAGDGLRRLAPGDQRVERWLATLTPLRDRLAARVIEGRPLTPGDSDELASRLRTLREEMPRLPASLHRDVLRPPACFRSLDQRPADVARLICDFGRLHPDRERPVLVVGVRTSGSYLAPLAVAALGAVGFRDADTLTIRPGFPLHRRERGLVRNTVRRGGVVAVIDDPPVTGQAIAAAVRQLRRHGVTEASATLLVTAFGPVRPPWLPGYPRVVLPFAAWSVHRQLAPAAVGDVLAQLTGRRVTRVDPASAGEDMAEVGRRDHVIAVFNVEWGDGSTGPVAVQGEGLGYLGRHSLAVAGSLGDYLPEVYGFHDGLLYRAWLPEEWRLEHAEPGTGAAAAKRAEAIAAYAARRATSMPARTDHSRSLGGRLPAWEVASLLLGRGFGRAGLPLRPLVIDAVALRLTAVQRPSVTDGGTGLRRWFISPEGRTQKIAPDVHHFSSADVECYDPVFDLAGVAPGTRDDEFVAALVASYEAQTGYTVDPERCLLYELVQLWDRSRLGRLSEREARRGSSRAAQRYFAARFLADVPQAGEGQLVALDVDGVLESDAFGFPATTPAGALALRALVRHGYRPVLVTGRSVDEVRERCRTYRLAAGVAEYGSALYDRASDQVVELLTAADRDQLARVRDALIALPGVGIDEDYTRSVRAFRVDPHGQRRHPEGWMIAAALSGADPSGPRVRAVRGDAQTDFVAGDADKGTGLRVLAATLGGERGAVPVALGVGDSDADLSMLEVARLAYAPGHARFSDRLAGLRVARQPYQVGLSEAVARLLGHRPGGCAACQLPTPPDRARLLLSVLGISEAGPRGAPSRMVRIALALARIGGRR